VRERIAGYTDAVLEAADPASLSLIAGEVASVGDLLAGSATPGCPPRRVAGC
jgi:hypothetical protein